VALFRNLRRPGAVGIAFTAWEIWKRLPPEHRNALVKQAGRYSSQLVEQLRAKRRPPK
jgi:hypothetical protein